MDRVSGLAREALDFVGLGGMEGRRPDSLSGGERRRLAIAGIVAMRPECIVLDEPFANLDFDAVRQVLSVMLRLVSAGHSLLVLTHELEKCMAHATRLAVMDGGRVVYDGAPSGLEPSRFEGLGLMNPYRHGERLEELTWLG